MDDTRPTRVVSVPPDALKRFGSTVDGAPAAGPAELAFERGRLQGIEEGRRIAAADLQIEREKFFSSAASSLRRLIALEESLSRDHERHLIEIALEAASRIVRERIESGDPVAMRALQEVMGKVPAGLTVRARVCPADLEPLQKELANEIRAGRVLLEADETIERGGCLASTGAGTVDATVETAMAQVRAAAVGAARTG